MAGWIVRDERPGDAAAIDALLLEAFGGPEEAALARALREAGATPVALVAAAGDRVIGHILFSPLAIEMDTGIVDAAALAPLAPVPGHRERGIGAALVEAGLARCREAGYSCAVVLGDPGYYRRFGFDPALAAGLACSWSGPHLMALALDPAAPVGPGRLRYHPAFEGLG